MVSHASYLEVQCVKEAGPRSCLHFLLQFLLVVFMTLEGYSGWTLCLYLAKDFHK